MSNMVSIHRAELKAIHDRLKECQDRLQANGERHSWLDPYIDIARERCSTSAPEGGTHESSLVDNVICDIAPDGKVEWNPRKLPFVPVVLPVRFDHISYEGEIWYDATGRMLDVEEVCNALNASVEK